MPLRPNTPSVSFLSQFLPIGKLWSKAVRGSEPNPDMLLDRDDEQLAIVPKQDLIHAQYDIDHSRTLTEVLLIFSTPRSGSTMFCEQLRLLDHVVAHEYLQPYQYLPILNARWDFARNGRIDWAIFAQNLIRYRLSQDGRLGINVHASHIPTLTRLLPYISHVPVRAIAVSREDKLAQALSYARARTTQAWSSHFDAIQPYETDFKLAAELLKELQEQEIRISTFCELCGFSLNWIHYEKLVENPVAGLNRITGLDPVAIERALGRERATRTKRQSNTEKLKEEKCKFARYLEGNDT